MEENTINLKPARKTFSLIGFALCIYIAVSLIGQLALFYLPELIWGGDNWYYNTTWGQWIASFVPMYALALPVFVLTIRKLPAQKPTENKLGVGQLIIFFLISYFFIYVGNIIGTVLSAIFSGGTAENQIAELAMDMNPIKVVVMVILAPIVEEFIFRKLIIDRTAIYGEKIAIFMSAFAFGLLHQNLFQFFYAFGVGLIFGYIYMRTGKIRYSIILHTIINFIGSVVTSYLLKIVDIDKIINFNPNASTEELMALVSDMLPGLLLYMLYSTVIMGIVIAGLVFFIIRVRRLKWEQSEQQLQKGTVFKTVYLNVGMILYIVICTVFVVIALF